MSFAAVLARLQQIENPFPGLRPFDTSEAHLFFGRDQQIAELLNRLERHRFVAVVGLSGSGKSSLVRAGLIPALRRGPIAEAKARWRIVVMRPAGAPFASLASELKRQAFDPQGLRQSSHGLVETAKQLGPDESLLLVVDQFEELFRYKEQEGLRAETKRTRVDSASETAEFVQLLLTASRRLPPIFIVLTMRSDYLGDCAEFRDLPEKLNDSQYLVPRLTREQRQETIQGPLGRVEISPSLLQRILNDTGDEPDQLPVLQHALMRTWEFWRRADPDHTRRIELVDYEAAGCFENALNNHADELLKGVDEKIAERIFRRLTIRGFDNRERRDPATLAELWAVNAADTPKARQKVCDVIDHFRKGSAAFLVPRAEQVPELAPDDYLDITHESLIREWAKLRQWLNEESEWRTRFLGIVGDARLWERHGGNLWRDPELQTALNWWQAANPNPVWAERYSTEPGNADFESAQKFLEHSRRARDDEARRERMRRKRRAALLVGFTVSVALLTMVFFILTLKMRRADRKSIARQLLAESFYDSTNPTKLQDSILLAAQSARFEPNELNTYALEQGLSVLQNPVVGLQTKDPILTVAFSPDGQYIAAGGWDKIIHLSRKNGIEAAHLDAKGVVTSVVFTPDGKYLASGADDGFVRIFEVESRKEIWRSGLLGVVRKVAFSPDSRYVGEASDYSASITAWRDPHAQSIFLPQTEVQSIVFSPDGAHVATGGVDKTVRLFDMRGKEVWPKKTFNGSVRSLAFSPHGRLVAAASDDKTARVFDAENGRQIWLVLEERGVRSVAFSPDGHFLATGGADRTARVFDIGSEDASSALAAPNRAVGAGPKTQDQRRRPPEVSHLSHDNAVNAVAFSPDSGRYVLTASDDSTARLFETLTSREVTRHVHAGGALAIAFSSDGQYIATAGVDGVVSISNTSDHSEMMNIPEKPDEGFAQMSASVDGHFLATLSSDSTVRVLDLSNANVVCGPFVPRGASFSDIAVSNGGTLVAVGGEAGLAAFQCDAGKQVGLPRLTRAGVVNSIDMTPDGRYVAALFQTDNTLQVIDASNGKPQWSKPSKDELTVVAFSPSGAMLAAAGKGESVSIFRTSSGEPVGRKLPHKFEKACMERLFNPCQVNSITFSFNEKWIATGSNDLTARLYDIQESREIRRYAHPSDIVAVGFSRHDQYLASASRDLTGRIFETSTARLASTMPLQSLEFFPIGFTGDDKYVIGASTTGSLRVVRRLWRAKDLADEACTRLQQRKITPEQWRQIASGNPPETCPNRP